MVITLLNQKGGVGKSTVAYLLACALKAAQVDVAIRDGDPQQGTLTSAVRRLGEIQIVGDGGAGIIVQDTPGHLDLHDPKNRAEAEQFIRASDRVLLVSEMSLQCVEAAATTAALVKACLAPRAKAFVLWNKVRVSTATGLQDKNALAKAVGLPGMKNWLPLASCYEDALAVGYAKSLSDKAKQRRLIEALALEVLA